MIDIKVFCVRRVFIQPMTIIVINRMIRTVVCAPVRVATDEMLSRPMRLGRYDI